jgi:hypothetical protein
MKKYLVISCISENDTQFPDKWVSENANYDLIYLCYSKSKIFQNYLLKLGVKCYQVYSGKWKNIKAYFDKYKLENYKYFFFPDPDLEISIEQINKLFDFASLRCFDLCQPAVTLDSFESHSWLYQQKDSVFRPVKFVEVMCPCFKREILEKLLWTFDLSYSGYGLDLLWAKYFQGYVIDSITVKHLREQNFRNRAKMVGFPDPLNELKMIKEKYL